MMTWLVTAALTLIAALSYGELAAAMPHAGGQYVYLREAFGPLAGFLFGWTMFAVIQTGTIAAVAVAFAKYTGVFFPSISDQNYLLGSGGIGVTTQQLLAIAVIVFLTGVNTRGIRTGAMVQNVFTFAKIGSLLALVAAGFLVGRNPAAVASNFTDFWRNAGWNFDTVRLVGVAMVGALFSSDAWNNVTFHGGRGAQSETQPAALAGARRGRRVGALHRVQHRLPERADARRHPARAGRIGWRRGCCRQHVRPGGGADHGGGDHDLHLRLHQRPDPLRRARLLRDGAGPACSSSARNAWTRKSDAPVFSLAVQCVWASLLTLSGRYGDLLDYVIFAVLLFYILTIAGLFVLRRTSPEMERPYKAIGYPVLPAVYILAAGLIEILLLMYKPNYTWPGLIIVLLGVPVYFIWRKKATI